MDRTRIGEFSESLSRCMVDPAFLTRFYELFLGASPEIAEKFRDTDFDRQKRALSSSLYVMVMAMEGGDAARIYIDQIAKRHGQGDLDIRPELYDLWLECLIKAVREYDPECGDEVEQSWRSVMREGIELMTSRY